MSAEVEIYYMYLCFNGINFDQSHWHKKYVWFGLDAESFSLKENINKMIDFVVCMMIFLIKIRQMFIQFLNRPQAIL